MGNSALALRRGYHINVCFSAVRRLYFIVFTFCVSIVGLKLYITHRRSKGVAVEVRHRHRVVRARAAAACMLVRRLPQPQVHRPQM